MLIKPNQAIIEWFNKLTPGQRSDAAFLFLSMLQRFSISDLLDTEKMQEDFISFLRVENEEFPLLKIGKVLCARALINWIMRKRGTLETWEAEKNIDTVQDAAKGDEYTVNFLQKEKMQFPLRKRQWVKTAATWREMCSTVISDESLDKWELELPPSNYE